MGQLHKLRRAYSRLSDEEKFSVDKRASSGYGGFYIDRYGKCTFSTRWDGRYVKYIKKLKSY